MTRCVVAVPVALGHSSETLNRLLRGSLGLVSIRFQDNAVLDRAVVAAFKNKSAPDNSPLAWILSKPIAIIAPWMCHAQICLGHSEISTPEM